MSTSPSETSDIVHHGSLFQNSVYIGINIQNILYGESRNACHETMETYHFVRTGVVLVLYFRTMVILLRNRGEHETCNLFYAIFSSMTVFSITIWVATQALFGEKMWLLDSDFPGS